IKDCSHVVHLAAQTDVISSIEDPYNDAETNVMGTINLLNAAKQQNVSCFVQASSAAPLGEQDPPVDENKVPQPLSGYGASKLSCEGYCSAFAASYGLHTVALRFSNVYGPYSYQKGSVIAKFVRQIINHKPVTIYGEGNQTRDFVHASDIAQAIFLSLTNKKLSGFSLFQIGTGVETSINTLYKTIASRFQPTNTATHGPQYEPARPGEIIRNYCDISHAVDLLGFQPRISIEKGIEDTIDWFVDHYQTQPVVTL
ncbi:MAG: GDP-mannose 4,6-dehydratase, partial [Thermoplasmatota archaeon]